MRRRLRSEQGDLNIAGFALSLPILLLIVTAAVDIARLPIAKQQSFATLQAGFDNFIDTQGDNATTAMLATGRDWCAFMHSSYTDYSECDTCGGGTATSDPPTCTVDKDAISARGGAETAIDTMLAMLQGGAGYAFLDHDLEDIEIVLGVYNLLVDKDDGTIGSAEAVMKTNVAVRPSDATAYMPAGSLGYSIDLDAIAAAHFTGGGPGANALGVTINTGSPSQAADGGPSADRYTHTSVLIGAIALRINHLFPFTQGLTFGATPEGGGPPVEGETTLLTYNIRPLPLAFRLSGGKN